jgi:hypothetical protein
VQAEVRRRWARKGTQVAITLLTPDMAPRATAGSLQANGKRNARGIGSLE